MSITKVGSSYNFIYNTKTGKLSTKDGSKNEFVDFCNGDVKGEDTETLNHFDEHTRYQFTRMLFAYGTGMTGQNPFALYRVIFNFHLFCHRISHRKYQFMIFAL